MSVRRDGTDRKGRAVTRRTAVVTGGAGFIGSELVRQLAARGDRVVAIDNLANGTRDNLTEVLRSEEHTSELQSH